MIQILKLDDINPPTSTCIHKILLKIGPYHSHYCSSQGDAAETEREK